MSVLHGWGRAALLLSCGVFAATQIGKLPPAIPALREAFGFTLVQMGWLASLFNIVAATCGLAAGWVADRIGRRTLLKFGLIALGLGALVGALTPTMGWLFPARIVEGLGFLCIVVAAPVLVREAIDSGRQRLALGIWSCYTSVGMALMLLLSPWLLPVFGWRSGWWLGVVGAVAFAGLAFLAFPGRGSVITSTRGAPGLTHGLGQWAPWCLAGCFGLYTMQWMALSVWMPTYLLQHGGLGLASTGALVALMVIVNAPGNVVGGWLSQRGWPLSLLLLGPAWVMGLTGWAVFGASPGPNGMILLSVLFSLFGGILPATVYGAVPALAARHDNLGAINGLVVQCSNAGALAGPPLAAALVSAAGWQAIAPMFIVGALLSSGLALLALRTMDTSARQPEGRAS